jgi:hypothetical protein
MVPPIVEELLQRHDPHRDSVNPDIHPCQGAKFHSPRPLKVHPCKLGNNHLVYLCGTCLDNLNTYLFLNEAEGTLEWEVLRCFGNSLRSTGMIALGSKKGKND